MRPPLRVLWRHYSSQVLWLVAAIGSLWQFVPEFREHLPPWGVSVIAFCGLACKLIPQREAGDEDDIEQRRRG